MEAKERTELRLHCRGLSLLGGSEDLVTTYNWHYVGSSIVSRIRSALIDRSRRNKSHALPCRSLSKKVQNGKGTGRCRRSARGPWGFWTGCGNRLEVR